MSNPKSYHGSIIALDGPSDLIATQLRLLPASAQILILPSIHNYLEQTAEQPFHPRNFIRRIHCAAAARYEAALEFLQDAASQEERLVLMNGSTVGAQALCIAAISEHRTQGNLVKADTLFYDYAKSGLIDLPTNAPSRRDSTSSAEDSDVDELVATYKDLPSLPNQQSGEVIMQAMMAAEALDRETEALHPPSHDLDLTMNGRHSRSQTLPVLHLADFTRAKTPYVVFGNRAEPNSSTSVSAKRLSRIAPRTQSFLLDHISALSTTGDSTLDSEQFSDIDNVFETLFPPASKHMNAPAFTLRPAQPGASHNDPPRQGSVNSLRKRRSLDRISFEGHVKYTSGTTSPSSEKSKPCMSSVSTEDASEPCSKPSSVASLDGQGRHLHGRATPEPLCIPRSIFSSDRSLLSTPSGRDGPPIRDDVSYLDIGVETPVLLSPGDSDATTPRDTPLTNVLPLVEDKIIIFSDESQSTLLDFVVQRFREGVYPVQAEHTLTGVYAAALSPITPTFAGASTEEKHRVSLGAVLLAEPSIVQTEDYDPFRADGQFPSIPPTKFNSPGMLALPALRSKFAPRKDSLSSSLVLPTSDERFHMINAKSLPSAVSVQNALRTLLSEMFPSDELSHQFRFPQLPWMGPLWRPCLDGAVPSSQSPLRSDRGMDLIVAIGAQNGVNKKFRAGVTAKIEELGTKLNGQSRGGRLELRYLIATVMQAFTVQPLATQAQANPMTDHSLLATLIVPHLETYLVAHADVKYLVLEYAAEHFPVVLALQNLVGSDMMKVAGIVDGEEATFTLLDQTSRKPAHHKTGSAASLDFVALDSAVQTASVRASMLGDQSPDQSFSKANFLLVSSATEPEINTFVNTIQRMLAARSPFYLRAPSIRKPPARIKHRYQSSAPTSLAPGSAQDTYASPARVGSWILASFPLPPLSPLPERSPMTESYGDPVLQAGLDPASDPSRQSWRPRPSAKSVAGSRSTRSRRSRFDGESLYAWVDNGDEDEDYDCEVRRLMPMFVRQRAVQAQKERSDKALKLLGIH